MKTKLAQLLEFMKAENWHEALRLANSFGRLGDQKADITRAWNAIQNPGFYEDIGQNPQELVKTGVMALKSRYLT